MCGKVSQLLVKYPFSCGQPNFEFFLLWAALIDDVHYGLRVTVCGLNSKLVAADVKDV